MQLVAYGAQDIYLTGNPQITFFKVVYRRHTNFSMEAIEQSFSETPSYKGGQLSSTLSRSGDLVYRLWLDAELPDIIENQRHNNTVGASGLPGHITWTNNVGHALIKECEVEIGGQLIDKHYSQWLDIYTELTDKNYPLDSLLHKKQYLIDDPDEGGQHNSQDSVAHAPSGILKVYIPLMFWFCRNVGLALPLISLQYHEVKIKLLTRALYNLMGNQGWRTETSPPEGDSVISSWSLNGNNTLFTINTSSNLYDYFNGPDPKIRLYADYIYLDTDERRRFAQVSHEYLIEQVQRKQSTLQGGIDVPTVTGTISTATDAGANGEDATLTLTPGDAAIKSIVNYWQNAIIEYTSGDKVGTKERIIKSDENTLGRESLVQPGTVVSASDITGETYTISGRVRGPTGTAATGFTYYENIHNIKLNFNHPVKELIWVIQSSNCLKERTLTSATTTDLNISQYSQIVTVSDSTATLDALKKENYINDDFKGITDYFNYYTRSPADETSIGIPVKTNETYLSRNINDAFGTAKVVLNGSDRFSERDALYFRTVQPYQAGHNMPRRLKHIYCYSFALKPEEHQPSGSCNFSRIDNAELIIKSKNGSQDRTISIFAINYNVLRIMSGMGGLAYSN